jgi:hypothetical protein
MKINPNKKQINLKMTKTPELYQFRHSIFVQQEALKYIEKLEKKLEKLEKYRREVITRKWHNNMSNKGYILTECGCGWNGWIKTEDSRCDSDGVILCKECFDSLQEEMKKVACVKAGVEYK